MKFWEDKTKNLSEPHEPEAEKRRFLKLLVRS